MFWQKAEITVFYWNCPADLWKYSLTSRYKHFLNGMSSSLRTAMGNNWFSKRCKEKLVWHGSSYRISHDVAIHRNESGIEKILIFVDDIDIEKWSTILRNHKASFRRFKTAAFFRKNDKEDLIIYRFFFWWKHLSIHGNSRKQPQLRG